MIKIRVEPSKTNIKIKLDDKIVVYYAGEPQIKEVEYVENGEYSVEPDVNYDLEEVKIKVNVPIPEGYLKPEGTKVLTENGIIDITEYKYVDVQPDLENIEITPTKEEQRLNSENAYGFNDVVVKPIPDEYIIPKDVLDITENGEYNVTDKASVNVNVSSSGEDMLQARVNVNNSCNSLFYNYGGTNVDFIKNLDTSNVTSTANMFYNCKSLTSIPSLDTSNVTEMYNMFYNNRVLTSIPSLNTSKVTDMNNMFYSCEKLTSIPQLDTSKATNMSKMFQYCKSLTSIPQLDTSKATTMNNMFAGCSVLTSIPLLDTSKATTIYSMFENCVKLTSIPLLDTSEATNMSSMFVMCTSLTSIPQLNTSKVTNMANMFKQCVKLKSILMYGMKVKFDISASTHFETSDLVTILSNCQIITSSQTLTMGSTNLAKLDGVYVKPTGVELFEGITCNPCVICESTEEGAMLATEYFTAKGWTLA